MNSVCFLVLWTLLLPDGSHWQGHSETLANKEEAVSHSLRIIKRYKGHEPWVQLMTMNIREAECQAKKEENEEEE